MLNTGSHLWAVTVSAAIWGASCAMAAAIGPGSANAVLGQPLDFVVQLRIDGSEALSAECISAEVSGGERRVPASQVRTQFEVLGAEQLRVRVTTLQGLDEPVISVLVHVGCQTRSTRQFVVLADPPVAAPQPSPSPPAAALPLVSLAAPEPTAPTRVRAVQATPEPSPKPKPQTPPKTALAVRAERPALAKTAAATAPARGSIRSTAMSSVSAPAPAPAPAPRLKLEASEPVVSAEAVAVEQAIEVVTQAVVAARAAASAAALAEQRIATLEKSVLQMQAESKASRELALELATKLSQADSGSRWMVPLMLALGGLLALAAWLAWRLAALRGGARRDPWQAATKQGASELPVMEPVESREATAPIPFVTAELPSPASRVQAAPVATTPARPPPAPARPLPTSQTTFASPNPAPDRQRAHPAWPPAAPPQDDAVKAFSVTLQANSETTSFERTLPAGSLSDLGAARDVSIEELIDLEQQAEFFVVLGQDDSAIDLLMEHLRSTGGGSPLPYLKLLEIYHRLGDRSAFERTRTRFNQRFNAYAPEWEVGLQHGRSLDAYVGVLPRLQQVWARPLDAMAELEALLFRKSRGDLFDLPAYREVLFLYSLARDLLDRESADSGSVDLLLPLSSSGDFSSTAPYAYMGNDRRPGSDGSDAEDRPTAPVDLDLTASDKPSSIFDPFDERAQSGRR
jgi:pilus assembly protein FimV